MIRKGEGVNGLIGENAEFEGMLVCSGDITIEGRFKGELSVRGTLFVGEDAEVEAEIHAAQVVIAGQIRGNIIADEKIELSRPGKVLGNIQAPILVIDEGVIFEGNCRMNKTDEREFRSVSSESSEGGLVLISSQSEPSTFTPLEPSQ